MEQKSDLPILGLHIEDKNGDMVIHYTNNASDGLATSSAEVIHVLAGGDTCNFTKGADNLAAGGCW